MTSSDDQPTTTHAPTLGSRDIHRPRTDNETATPQTSAIAVDTVFAALADSSRRHLLERLALEGAQSATELAQNEDISRQAIVKHLRILERAQLLSRHKTGRDIRYTVSTHEIAATGRWMQRMAERWARLKPQSTD